MNGIQLLLQNNERWAEQVKAQDPEFFVNLSKLQKPRYLWIGCSDSRVPANEIVGLKPGEVFVHRNVANLVVHTDLNCGSVIEYAVGVLGVTDIIVCGHYGCGGVTASMGDKRVGLIDNWLRHLRDLREKHAAELDAIVGEDARLHRMCELNVLEQVKNVASTSVVQQAWADRKPLAVHGLVYGLEDGRLKPLGIEVGSVDAVSKEFRLAME